MSYETTGDAVVSAVEGSDLPASLKSAISNLLSGGGLTPLSDPLTAGEVTFSGNLPTNLRVTNIKQGGDYNASPSNDVVLFDTGEDVRLQITVPGPINSDGSPSDPVRVVVVLGNGNDVINFASSGNALAGNRSAFDEEGSSAGSTIDGAAGNDSITATSGDDFVLGGIGDDSIFGGFGADTIDGGQGNDTIIAGGGDDLILFSSGNDTIDGGAGFDQLSVGDAKSSFTISVADGSLVFTNTATGDVTQAKGTEFVSFAEGGIALALGDQEQAAVARLYEALLERGADAAGLEYWANLVEEGTLDLNQITEFFLSSGEFQSSTNADLSDQAFMQFLYQEAFNRTADDAGLNFWTSVLEQGQLSRAEVTTLFVEHSEAVDAFDYIQIVGNNNVDFT